MNTNAHKIIKKWLKKQGLTFAAASRATGYTRQHIEAVCNGREAVSARFLLTFEKLSDGELKAADLL
ncbi:MAG: hypothetical protein ACN2B6_01105 [Rickettsiales bacterium]